MSIIIQRQRVTQLVQITSQIVLTRSLIKFENHTLVHRYFMSVFYLGDKDGLDVQQLRSNVLAVDVTLYLDTLVVRFLPRFGDVILLHILKVRCFRHVHDGPAVYCM